jgi:hypothetical protein
MQTLEWNLTSIAPGVWLVAARAPWSLPAVALCWPTASENFVVWMRALSSLGCQWQEHNARLAIVQQRGPEGTNQGASFNAHV